MKTNTYLYHFSDNDFNRPLKEAILYVHENKLSDLSIEALKFFVVKAMVGFNSVKRIDMFSFKTYENREALKVNFDYEKYFTDVLEVSVMTLKGVPDNFDGYIYDERNKTATYFTY